MTGDVTATIRDVRMTGTRTGIWMAIVGGRRGEYMLCRDDYRGRMLHLETVCVKDWRDLVVGMGMHRGDLVRMDVMRVRMRVRMSNDPNKGHVLNACVQAVVP